MWYISVIVELIACNGITLLLAHTAAVPRNRGQSTCPAESRGRKPQGAEDDHFAHQELSSFPLKAEPEMRT